MIIILVAFSFKEYRALDKYNGVVYIYTNLLEGIHTIEMAESVQRQIRTYSNDHHLVDERRRQIVLSSTKVFAKKGYERTTMRDLAEAFGMTKGGLYHYVGSKEDVRYLILQLAISETNKVIDEIRLKVARLRLTEALALAIRMYFESVDGLQDMYNFINHVAVTLSLEEREIVFESQRQIIAYFNDLLIKGIEEGQLEAADTRFVAHIVIMLANAWANRRWFLRKHYSLEEYILEAIGSVLKVIGVTLSVSPDNRECLGKRR